MSSGSTLPERGSKPMELESPRLSGLDECRDMDEQLAAVASATFGDIERTFLDDIFQYVNFIELLTFRRVSLGWKSAISRESAPFLRNVQIDLGGALLSRLLDKSAIWNPWWRQRIGWKLEWNCWQFAKKANSVTFCNWSSCAEYFWSLYEAQVAHDKRTQRIQKVIYVNTCIYSGDLQRPNDHSGSFTIVLYNTEILLRPDSLELYYWYQNCDESELMKQFNRKTHLRITVTSKDSLTLPPFVDKSRDAMYKDRIRAPTYFALRHVEKLTEGEILELHNLAGWHGFLTHTFLPFAKEVLEKLDPDNSQALEYCLKGDVVGFVATAHPLVLRVMHVFATCAD